QIRYLPRQQGRARARPYADPRGPVAGHRPGVRPPRAAHQAVAPVTDDWIDYYDSAHTIYVNARHRDLHFIRIARDLARHVPDGATVLDCGCGGAVHADIVAAKAGRLILCEPAPGVRARLAERWRDTPKIEVCGPDELAALADHSVDVAVMHSVAQYLTSEELDTALALFRRLLRAAGSLLLGDAIRPQHPPLSPP